MLAFIITVCFAILGLILLRRIKLTQNSGLSFAFLAVIFILKIFGGIAYGEYHKRRFPNSIPDTWGYFKDANIIHATLPDKPLHWLELTFGKNGRKNSKGKDRPDHLSSYLHEMNGYWEDTDAYMVVRINALIRLFSFGHYPVHIVVLSLLSTIGLLYIFNFLKIDLPHHGHVLALAVFCIPSILFYGSGLHKEPIIIFGLGSLLYGLKSLLDAKKLKFFLLFLVGLLILLGIKSQLVICLMVPLGIYLWTSYYPKHTFWKFALSTSIFWIGLIYAHHLPFIDFDLAGRLMERQLQFSHAPVAAMSAIDAPAFSSSGLSILTAIPHALVNSILRPFPTDNHHWKQWFYFMETLLLYGMLVTAIINIRAWKFTPLMWFCFWVSISQFILIGLAVPNLGAISRYKVPMLVFFIFVVLKLCKIPSKLHFLKRIILSSE